MSDIIERSTGKSVTDAPFLLFSHFLLIVTTRQKDASYLAPDLFPQDLTSVVAEGFPFVFVLQQFFEAKETYVNQMSDVTVEDYRHRIDEMTKAFLPFRERFEHADDAFVACIDNSEAIVRLSRTDFMEGMALLDEYIACFHRLHPLQPNT